MRPTNQLPPWCDWSGESIAEAIARVVQREGQVPTVEQYKLIQEGDMALPSTNTIYRAYGSYHDALRAAGINPREINGSVDEALALLNGGSG